MLSLERFRPTAAEGDLMPWLLLPGPISTPLSVPLAPPSSATLAGNPEVARLRREVVDELEMEDGAVVEVLRRLFQRTSSTLPKWPSPMTDTALKS